MELIRNSVRVVKLTLLRRCVYRRRPDAGAFQQTEDGSHGTTHDDILAWRWHSVLGDIIVHSAQITDLSRHFYIVQDDDGDDNAQLAS